MTPIDASPPTEGARGGKDRVAISVHTLSELVGAHPDALRRIYTDGRATLPQELGDAPRGRLLSMAMGTSVFMLMRPVMRALGRGILPWRGKVFDHGGNSGQNVIVGRPMARFRTEVGPSALDAKPALVLYYSDEALHNFWPIRAIRDELRTVGEGLAIGPVFLERDGSQWLVCWFGLEDRNSSG